MRAYRQIGAVALVCLACGSPTGPRVDPCAAIPWKVDLDTGIQYKVCNGNIERNNTMTVKKEVTKDVPLTTAQVDRLNLLSAQSNTAATKLNEYLGGILDAKGISGGWNVEGLDKKTLRLRKNEG